MKFIYPFVAIALLIAGCSKSPDLRKESISSEISEPSMLSKIEEMYGIEILDSDDIILNNNAFTISEDEEIIVLQGSRKSIPWIGIFDLKTKGQLLDHEFKNDPKEFYLGYGENMPVNMFELVIKAKSKTHLYGVKYFGYDGSGVGSVLLVSEIASKKVIEYNPFNGSNIDKIIPWFNGSILIQDYSNKYYKVMDIEHKLRSEGALKTNITIPGIPVNYSQSIHFETDNFKIYNIQGNVLAVISYNPKDNSNDKADVKIVTVKDNIATFVFKVTTYENKITEKTIKVDFENYKVI